MASKSEINFLVIFTIGVVSACLLVVIVIGVQAMFVAQEQAEIAGYDTTPVLSLENLKLQQQVRLNSYRWVDREKQMVAIPIDQAMRIMAETQGKLPTTQPAVNTASNE
ncbi:MAG TPA: hypothetical protein VHP11_15060 [Tepidisphaeraceae bacterium]|nr:hypothetical protein [Tepidisphaeraceae bacterium]